MFQPNFKHQKWIDNLEEIHNKVFFLQFNNKEFHSLSDKFNNKKLTFEIFRFARRNYTTFTSMGIRQLVDRDSRVVSLIKLLDDIEKNSDAYKRSWFLKQYPNGVGEPLFREFFNIKSNTLKKEVVKKDIGRLLRATKKITVYANKWEAHWDKDRHKITNPTCKDLDAAIASIVRVYKRYYYLLKQSSRIS